MKTILKLNLNVLIAIFVLFLITISCSAAISPENGGNESTTINYNFSDDSTEPLFFVAPLNPAFLEYQEEMEQSHSAIPTNRNMVVSSDFTQPESLEESSDMLNDHFLDEGGVRNPFTPPAGLVPSPVDLSHLSAVNMEDLLADETYSDMPSSMAASILLDEVYPSRYDLRDVNGVTSVKDQGQAGSCWTFSSLASLESYLIHQRSETWDFSENHPKNTVLISYENGFDSSSPDEGGNNMMALAYLARWDGPIMESDDPYDDLSSVSSSDIVIGKHVQEVFIFPFVNNSSDISKLMIMEYGAIAVAIHSDPSRFFNEENNTYYCYDEDATITHAVTLIGWDDNFDRNKFTPTAPGNGAYIVKNSWGDNWGEDGYFYVSYYDTSIGTLIDNIYKKYSINFLFTADNVSNYDRIYQYDPLGWCKSIGDSDNSLIGANVFTADSNETLEAVSFYAVDSNSSYNISIYLDPEDGPVNASGPVSVKNGSIPIAGYHTVDLDSSVTLSAGQNFSIVITFNTPGFNYPVAVEQYVYGYSSHFHSEAGQSYASSDGVNWVDVSALDMNICIKAFTKENKIPEAAFVADRRYVHVNATVNFSDASIFSPDSWEWDFGDNSTSTLQNPSHSYAVPGTYNVTLNASNSFGDNITTRSSFIRVLDSTLTVNGSGTADFTLIQDAVEAASEGDTIIVEPGTYTERIRLRKDNITLRSSTNDPADVTVISSNPDKTDSSNYAFFLWANNVTLQNITVSDGFLGIYLGYSNECNVIGCRVTDNYYGGLAMRNSYNNSILNCTIDSNTLIGLYVKDCGNNYFANNSISGSIYNCFLDSQTDIIDTSNTVENKPIYYLCGVSDMVIGNDSNAGKISLIDCSNITIKDIEIQNTYFGVQFYNTTSSTVNNCTFTDNGYGIYMTDSEDNTVFDSTLSDNNNYGIFLSECNDNLLFNNYFNNTNNVVISGCLSNQWNITMSSGSNIINGSYLGGNYWATPEGTGWSQAQYSTGNGFCSQYEITDDGNNIDYLPLTSNEEQQISSAASATHSNNDGINIRIATSSTSPSNIVVTDSSILFVGKDAEVQYVFTDRNTPVTDISFRSEINEGYVMATVNLLKDLPENAPAPSSVKVYQGMEIVLGDESFSSGVGEATIEFSVSKEWLDSNGFDGMDIHMEHFSSGVWNRLPTTVTGEDEEYVYYEATTTGFSPFIICADTVTVAEEVTGVSLEAESVSKTELENQDQVPVGMDSNNNKLLLFLVFVVITISVLVLYWYKRK